jgi:hypothetical protein
MRRGYLNPSIGLAVGVVVLVAIGSCASCRRTPAGAAPPPAAPSATPPQPSATAPVAQPPPTTAEGCRACNGDFGIHGLSQTPACNCRTRDGGRRCRSKDDCQGECIADGDEHDVTDPGPPPRGYFIGRCAEFVTSFGCHRFLPAGAPGPVRLDAPPTQLCVD